MEKALAVFLILLNFACCLRQGSAQLCACNDTACQSQTMQNNPTQQQTCCQWVPQPIDTDPQSLNDPNGTPLGFLLAEYRGTDSNLPDYCVRFDYPTPLRNFRYVVVSVESNSNICIRKRDGGADDEPMCGSGGVFFCESYTSGSSIELEFFCHFGSCPVNDEQFYFKPNITTLDVDDEYFCDNINRTLPSALLNHELPTPIANPNPAPSFPDCPNGNTYPTPLPTNTVTTNGRPTTSTNDSELVADLATTNYSRASLSLAVLAVLLTIALI